jgi:hypothetical protein
MKLILLVFGCDRRSIKLGKLVFVAVLDPFRSALL